MTNCFEFTVSLRGIKPRIWRRFQIAGDATFYDLHDAIQDSFGWDRSHMWEFRAPGRRGRVLAGLILDDDWGLEEVPDADSVTLAEYFDVPPEPENCEYVYDFGDHWAHSVKLTRRIASPEGFHRRLLAGRRAGPPDDCGGTYGYDRLVELHRIGVDERDADSDGRAGWIVGGWTPDAFDLDAVKHNFDR